MAVQYVYAAEKAAVCAAVYAADREGMDCKRANELLVDYLYQELDPSQMDQFESHLQGCHACTDELATYESTRQLARLLPEVDPPPGVSQRLLQQAATAVRPERASLLERLREGLRVMVLHPALTAAVMLVVVASISFYAYRRGGPPTNGLRPDTELHEMVRPSSTPGSETLITRGKREAVPQEDTLVSSPLDRVATVKAPSPTHLKTTAKSRAIDRLRKAPKQDSKPKKRLALELGQRELKRKELQRVQLRKGAGARGDQQIAETEAAWPARAGRSRAAGDKAAASEAQARHWLIMAQKAQKAGRCQLALKHYDRALRLQPTLRPNIAPRIRSCVSILARSDAASLRQARKRYPMLDSYFEQEVVRSRRARSTRATSAAGSDGAETPVKAAPPAPTAAPAAADVKK